LSFSLTRLWDRITGRDALKRTNAAYLDTIASLGREHRAEEQGRREAEQRALAYSKIADDLSFQVELLSSKADSMARQVERLDRDNGLLRQQLERTRNGGSPN
jgi:hypothetical protein